MKFDDLYESLMASEGLVRSFKNLLKGKNKIPSTPVVHTPDEAIPIGYRKGHTLKNPALADKLTKQAKDDIRYRHMDPLRVHGNPKDKRRNIAMKVRTAGHMDPKTSKREIPGIAGEPNKLRQIKKQGTDELGGYDRTDINPINIPDWVHPFTKNKLVQRHGK